MQKALGPWSSLESRPREVLKQPPLALVICQVQYIPRIRANDSDVAGAFQDRIDAKYPLLEQMEAQRLQNLGAVGILPETRSSDPLKIFQFSDVKRDWTVALSSEFVSLECRSYPDFHEFLARFKDVLLACIETVHPTILRRIGFRYVNEIRIDSAEDAGRLIRPEVLGPLAVPPFAEQTITMMQSFELRTSASARINFSHGYFPSGTTVQPRPNDKRVDKAFYLVDVDVYRIFDEEDPTVIDIERIMEQVLTFHDTAAKFFWWAATDELIAECQEGGE